MQPGSLWSSNLIRVLPKFLPTWKCFWPGQCGGALACGAIPPVITADAGVKSVNTPGWPAVPGSKSGAGGASLPALYLESGHSRVPLSREIRIRPGGAEFDA